MKRTCSDVQTLGRPGDRFAGASPFEIFETVFELIFMNRQISLKLQPLVSSSRHWSHRLSLSQPVDDITARLLIRNSEEIWPVLEIELLSRFEHEFTGDRRMPLWHVTVTGKEHKYPEC